MTHNDAMVKWRRREASTVLAELLSSSVVAVVISQSVVVLRRFLDLSVSISLLPSAADQVWVTQPFRWCVAAWWGGRGGGGAEGGRGGANGGLRQLEKDDVDDDASATSAWWPSCPWHTSLESPPVLLTLQSICDVDVLEMGTRVRPMHCSGAGQIVKSLLWMSVQLPRHGHIFVKRIPYYLVRFWLPVIPAYAFASILNFYLDLYLFISHK